MDDDKLYKSIEAEFAKNKLKSVSESESKILVILFNSLVSVSGGKILFKSMVQIKNTNKFVDNLKTMPFPSYIHTCM